MKESAALNIQSQQFIESTDWDAFVTQTYERPYHFQQQEGCKSRGVFSFTVPADESMDDEMREVIPEEVNGAIMGVKFAVWLARDPQQSIKDQTHDYQRDLWWSRNFYPDFQTLANDLHAKGLLAAGDYIINIDW